MTAPHEVAIANLLSDYCWYVDRLDVEGVLGLFTQDATFDLGLGRSFTGHDELREMYRRLDGYQATSHHITNPRIEVSGDTATVRSGLVAFHVRHDWSCLTLWGYYLDVLVRTDRGWQIKERSLRSSHEQGGRPETGQRVQFEVLTRST